MEQEIAIFIIPDNLIVRLLWGVVGIAVILHWCQGVIGAMEELDEEQRDEE